MNNPTALIVLCSVLALPAAAQAPAENAQDPQAKEALNLALALEKDINKGMIECRNGKESEDSVDYAQKDCGFKKGTLEKEEYEKKAVEKNICTHAQFKKLSKAEKKLAKMLAALLGAENTLKEEIKELRPNKSRRELRRQYKKALGAYKKFYDKLETATKDCEKGKALTCPPLPEKIEEFNKK